MGKSRRGTKRLTADGHWQGRITLNNGQRPWMDAFTRKMSRCSQGEQFIRARL